MMSYILGVLAGLAWGAAWAALSCRISLKAIRKNTNKAIIRMNALRVLIDIVSLGTIFLLRHVLPFNAYMALLGTAVALSLITMIFAYKVAGGKIK